MPAICEFILLKLCAKSKHMHLLYGFIPFFSQNSRFRAMDPSLVEVLLIIALDSPPWGQYDVQPLIHFMASSQRRTPFQPTG
jgi:hypothetical protein